MKPLKIVELTTRVLILSMTLLIALPRGQAQAPGDVIPNRYIVKVKAGAIPRAIVARHGLAPDWVYEVAIKGFAGFIPPGLLRRLQLDPDVESIVPDRVVTVDGKPSGGGKTPPEVVPAGVTRIGATPGALSYTGADVGVAVADTGLDFNHTDLKPLGSLSFTAYGTSAQDGRGHGTHVGGIIAARDNLSDVIGVAPGATLYAVKVIPDTGDGTVADLMAGLEWIAVNAFSVSPPIRMVNIKCPNKTSDGGV